MTAVFAPHTSQCCCRDRSVGGTPFGDLDREERGRHCRRIAIFTSLDMASSQRAAKYPWEGDIKSGISHKAVEEKTKVLREQ